VLGVGRKVVPQPAFLSSSRRCSSVWGDSRQPSVPPRSPGLLPRRCRRDCPVPLRSPSCSAARSLSSPQTPRDGRTPPTDSPFGRVNTGLGGVLAASPLFPQRCAALTPHSGSQLFCTAPSRCLGTRTMMLADIFIPAQRPRAAACLQSRYEPPPPHQGPKQRQNFKPRAHLLLSASQDEVFWHSGDWHSGDPLAPSSHGPPPSWQLLTGIGHSLVSLPCPCSSSGNRRPAGIPALASRGGNTWPWISADPPEQRERFAPAPN